MLALATVTRDLTMSAASLEGLFPIGSVPSCGGGTCAVPIDSQSPPITPHHRTSTHPTALTTHLPLTPHVLPPVQCRTLTQFGNCFGETLPKGGPLRSGSYCGAALHRWYLMVLASAQLGARPERKDGGHPALCNATPQWLRLRHQSHQSPEEILGMLGRREAGEQEHTEAGASFSAAGHWK